MEQRTAAANAIRQIGTNGIPCLLKWANERPNKLKESINAYTLRTGNTLVPGVIRTWVAQPVDHTRANEGKIGFVILGEEGYPAIPQLTALAEDSRHLDTALWAIGALGNIGPRAFPALFRFAIGTNTQTRTAAIREIANFGTNAALAWPALIKMLHDPDRDISCTAAEAVGNLHLNPPESLAALADCLKSGDFMVRSFAAGNIGNFGDEARPLLPRLLEMEAAETDPATQWVIGSTIDKVQGKKHVRP